MKFSNRGVLALGLFLFGLLAWPSEVIPESELSKVAQTYSGPNTQWGPDPFYRKRVEKKIENKIPKTNNERAEATPDLPYALSAIISRNGIGVAIINDQIVREGDSLSEGVVVRRILNDKVLLKHGKRVVALKVEPFLGKIRKVK